MPKRILILTSNLTGHGHKSITEAISEHLFHKPDLKVHVIDGFSLGGPFGLWMGQLYGSVTRNAPLIWKICWQMSVHYPGLINTVTELAINNRLTCLLEILKPDVILSVHPNFNGSVVNLLHRLNLKIPFVTLIADLVNISPLWADSRVHCILCPGPEAQQRCRVHGVPQSKLITVGFPVRSKFYRQPGSTPEWSDGSDPWKCLIMSGAEGSGAMGEIATTLLHHFNCTVTIVTGRNFRLKINLERDLLPVYGARANVLGFSGDIDKLMQISDLAVVRGSPNVIMEAVAAELPVVVLGALPGQEEGNADLVEKYNLGVVCRHLKEFKPVINRLLADGGKALKDIRHSQRKYKRADISEKIAYFLYNLDRGRPSAWLAEAAFSAGNAAALTPEP